VLRFVAPGSDEYPTEKYAIEIEAILSAWATDLTSSPGNHSKLHSVLDDTITAAPFVSTKETKVRSGWGIDIVRREFNAPLSSGKESFLNGLHSWLKEIAKIETAECEIFRIEEAGQSPLSVRIEIRYDFVCERTDKRREERVGGWHCEWFLDSSQGWKARRWNAENEMAGIVSGPGYIDITARALGGAESYSKQLLHGADYWRTILDGAIGVDLYSNNGVAVGDFDNDGFDDFYVCQPAGLPNRLYRNRGDGTFEDVTEKAGVGVLDRTPSAIFADFDNRGLQDLLVVCGTGPLLFINQGNGTFQVKRDAFKLAQPPQGTFTHAAVADYDRDGRLDIYLCTYMYYLGLDQYHYPIPYYDARNGPPNCLVHNAGNGTFVEVTQPSGLNTDNDRYSFSAAWGDSNGNGLPDIFVANDFGSSQLYRNNGDGTFTVVSAQAHIEDVGAGMSCCWADYDNDGRQDIYVPSMWEAAGQRVSLQNQFHEKAPEHIRGLYQRHARGNALYRSRGDGTFENVGQTAAVATGRWSWSSDFLDYDHDGFLDLYVSNGYLSGPDRDDLAGFFWRQVVAKSAEDATPALAYERGWNAINELVRSDHTWHGYARNVMFANNHDGTFAEVSGALGLDFSEDCRSFALADIDHDGRLEIILKSRNAPQLRILHNALSQIGHSISFRLKGRQSNRDAIGTSVTVETGALKQTKYLQAGVGFLAQHSKELHFGIGDPQGDIRATVRWPNGAAQHFENLPSDQSIEIVEGESRFNGRPFSPSPELSHEPAPRPPGDTLPAVVATWLIDPLKAPDISLPDSAGTLHSLANLKGRPVLLNFWSSAAPSSMDQVKQFEAEHSSLPSGIAIIAVNVDTADALNTARTFASGQRFSFPVLWATEEIAGIYNLIYRHLFDRRRDLPIPVTFLLDPEGIIVRIYQGPVGRDQVTADLAQLPSTPAERMKKALPFPGLLISDSFRRNEFTYGVAMYQHGYLDQAESSFRQVVAAHPNDVDAYYNLGTLNLKRNNIPQAKADLEQAIKLQPEYPEVLNNLGMIAAQQGDANGAIQNFQKALLLRPGYAIALLNLGNIYRRQRDFEHAQECLERALALQPDDPETNYSLGMLFAQQEQTQKALDYLKIALDLRPNYPEALNNRGVIFVRNEDFTQAENEFRTAIRVAPGFEQSYLNLARLYVMRNDKEQAKRTLLDLLRVKPESPAAKQALESIQ
jgi:Flp pilus assembly protein TadD/peroxiredoxin